MNACCETPAFKPPVASAPESALKTVVLIGPPNAGKSTLFNKLTGLRQKVANYPGVTVEQRMGVMAGVGREDLTLIDLPGIYSLTTIATAARSPIIFRNTIRCGRFFILDYLIIRSTNWPSGRCPASDR